jgi:hypothetical protein
VPQGIPSQKIAFFIVTTAKTSDLTPIVHIPSIMLRDQVSHPYTAQAKSYYYMF